jgi:hypothetical protein
MFAGHSLRQVLLRYALLRHVLLRQVLAVIIALAAFGLARPAAAQAPAVQPPPNAVLIAKQIIEIKGVSAMFAPLVHGVIVKVRDQFIQTNFMWAKDLTDIGNNLEKEYGPRGSEIIDETARIYASHFTEAELKQLLAFYQSPLGRKSVAEEPKITDESMAYAGRWGDDLSVEIIDKMRAEMKKRGKDI